MSDPVKLKTDLTIVKEDDLAKFDSTMLGRSGTEIYKGIYGVYDRFEYVQELQGPKALEVYNKMRKSDGQTKLVLLVLSSPIETAKWSVKEPGNPDLGDVASAKEKEVTKFVNDWIFGEDFNFSETIKDILGYYWAGFSLFEKHFDITKDGKWIIKRLDWRAQSTIWEWVYDDKTHDLSGVRQYIVGGIDTGNYFIPKERFVCFTFQKEGKDYRGISALRSAYKHWFIKDLLYRLDGIQAERFGVGMPYAKEMDGSNISAEQAKVVKSTLQSFRSHELGYIYQPKGIEIGIIDGGAGKMVDMLPKIQHHDAQIVKSVMAQFLELGQTQTGARSLGETLEQTFLRTLQNNADYIANLITREVIRPVVRWNFGEDVRIPYLSCAGIAPTALNYITDSLSKLTAYVKSGVKIDAHLRDLMNIPQEDVVETPKPVQPETDGEDVETDDQAKEDGQVKAHAHKHTIKNMTGFDVTKTGDFGFWRPLRADEEYLALNTMRAELNDAKKELVDITKKSRHEVITELLGQISKAFREDDPVLIRKIDYSNALYKDNIQKVQSAMEDLYEKGASHVVKELKKQGVNLKNSSIKNMPGDDTEQKRKKKLKKWLSFEAGAFTEITLDKLVDAARDEAMTSIRTGVFDITQIKERLEAFSEKIVENSSTSLTNEAFQRGRQDKALQEAGDVAYALYSAILDENVCDACEELDLKDEKYLVPSDEYFAVAPPLRTCESAPAGNRCRCTFTYVSKREKEAEA